MSSRTLVAAILGLFVMTTAATAQVGVFVGPNGGVGVVVGPRGGYYDDGYYGGGMPGWRGTAVPYFYGGPYWGGPRFYGPRWRGHRGWHGGWRHHRRHH
jgi:hypothetical protein